MHCQAVLVFFPADIQFHQMPGELFTGAPSSRSGRQGRRICLARDQLGECSLANSTLGRMGPFYL